MIEKNLFFVWIGEDTPKYCNFCVDNFKRINPDFKIHYLKYTKKDIENYKDLKENTEFDTLFKKSMDDTLFLKTKQAIRYKKKVYTKFIVLSFLSVFKINLLTKYGGIFLDLDTYPIKPFDEKLLSLDSFYVDSFHRNNFSYKKRNPDQYFIGCQKGSKYEEHRDFSVALPHQDPFFRRNKKFLELRDKFLNCTLKDGERYTDKDWYIDHYAAGDWLSYEYDFKLKKYVKVKTLCEECKYDNMKYWKDK